MSRLTLTALMLAGMLISERAAAVPITLGFDQPLSALSTGNSLTLNVEAAIPDPVIAFGFDLLFDTTILRLTDTIYDPAWTSVAPPPPPVSDGAGFTGLLAPGPTHPGGIAGTAVQLLTLTFEALAPANTTLGLEITEGDLAEGFVLAAGKGFRSSVK